MNFRFHLNSKMCDVFFFVHRGGQVDHPDNSGNATVDNGLFSLCWNSAQTFLPNFDEGGFSLKYDSISIRGA